MVITWWIVAFLTSDHTVLHMHHPNTGSTIYAVKLLPKADQLLPHTRVDNLFKYLTYRVCNSMKGNTSGFTVILTCCIHIQASKRTYPEIFKIIIS